VLVYAMSCPLTMVMAVNPATLVLFAQIMEKNVDALLEDLSEGTLRRAPALTSEAAAHAERFLRPNPKQARYLRDRMRENGGCLTPALVWGDTLSAIATWQGGCAPFYQTPLRNVWGDVPQRCLGIRASEGTFTIPDRDFDASGVMAIGGHAVEFLPEDLSPDSSQEYLWADELEEGKRYRMIITTGAGFYRYDLADIVEVSGFEQKTPRLRFIRRAGGVSSITGEKLTEDQAALAMQKTLALFPHLRLNGYTLTPIISSGNEEFSTPYYFLQIECINPLENRSLQMDTVAETFDRFLQELNEEYADRRNGKRLEKICCEVLVSGYFARERAESVAKGAPDGQWKAKIIR